MRKKAIISFILATAFFASILFIKEVRPKVGSSHSVAGALAHSTPSSNGSSSATVSSGGTFRDGNYKGNVSDAIYGPLQVEATVTSGKIASVSVLQYPDTHGRSIYINQQALPVLQQEAIRAQSSAVDIVSGATYTSEAFAKSLDYALTQAQQ